MRSLRVQLSLWYSSLLALTLLLLAAFTVFVLRAVLNSRVDTALETYAEQVSSHIASQVAYVQAKHPGYAIDKDTEKRFIDSGYQAWGRYVQVVNPIGHVVVYSNAFRTASLPDDPPTRRAVLTTGQPRFVTRTDIGEYAVRVVTYPVRVQGKVLYLVQVGTSVEGVDAALQRASTLLLVITPSVFLISLLGGWTLVGRALQPVDEMTRAALTIESAHLDTRLVPPRTDNEIGRLASALNEMIARLENSFRQMERFSADASHELKTPLTAIRGEAEVALMGAQSPEETRRTLQSIIEETERLSAIVGNLLLLSRADANQVRIKQEPVALHEVLLMVYESLERLARQKRIEVDLEMAEEVGICGDVLWLHQLLANLVQNAINYTPEGGSVLLLLKKEIEASGTTMAVLEVSDTGPGIAPEHLPYLFDRFYRVDASRSRDQGGSGLGLNIARWIAESHNGQISVTSVVGQGTTFTVRLPVTQTEKGVD